MHNNLYTYNYRRVQSIQNKPICSHIALVYWMCTVNLYSRVTYVVTNYTQYKHSNIKSLHVSHVPILACTNVYESLPPLNSSSTNCCIAIKLEWRHKATHQVYKHSCCYCKTMGASFGLLLIAEIPLPPKDASWYLICIFNLYILPVQSDKQK